MRLFSAKKNVNLEKTAKKIVGKIVINKKGEKAGKVFDVVLDGNTVLGFVVKKGVTKFFVDYSYVVSIGKKIELKMNPLTRILGMKVFDLDGKDLGKVVDFKQISNTNNLRNFTVKKNIGKKRVIPESEIKVDSKNILLNKKY